MVLIGLPRLRGIIQNLKNDHRQLESRVGVCLQLSGLTKKDATYIAKSVWPDVDREIIDAMYAIAKSDIRQYVKIIERSQHIMALNKLDKIDLETVGMAAELIIRRNWR